MNAAYLNKSSYAKFFEEQLCLSKISWYMISIQSTYLYIFILCEFYWNERYGDSNATTLC